MIVNNKTTDNIEITDLGITLFPGENVLDQLDIESSEDLRLCIENGSAEFVDNQGNPVPKEDALRSYDKGHIHNWEEIAKRPTEYPPAVHKHSEYVTYSGVDARLEGILAMAPVVFDTLSGIANELANDQTALDAIYVDLAGKASINHDHHNYYYLKKEVDSYLESKSDVTHTHSLKDLRERDYTNLVNLPLDDNFHRLSTTIFSYDEDEFLIYQKGEYRKLTKAVLLSNLFDIPKFLEPVVVDKDTIVQDGFMYIVSDKVETPINFKLPSEFQIGMKFYVINNSVFGWKLVSNEKAATQVVYFKGTQSVTSSYSSITLAQSMARHATAFFVSTSDTALTITAGEAVALPNDVFENTVFWYPCEKYHIKGSHMRDVTGDPIDVPAKLYNVYLSKIHRVGTYSLNFRSRGYIEAYVPESFNSISRFTLSFWFRPSSDDLFDDGKDKCIIHRHEAFYVGLRNGKIICNIYPSRDLVGLTDLVPNVWYHIVLSFDTKYIMLYLNGVLEIGPIINSNELHHSDHVKNIYIGRLHGQTNNYRGYIDNIRFFSEPSSEADVIKLYSEV